MAEHPTPSDAEIIEAMRSTIFHRYVDAVDGVARAVEYLERQGTPLTLLQRQVIFFAVAAANRVATDTMDHAIGDDHFKDAGWPRAAALLRRLQEE